MKTRHGFVSNSSSSSFIIAREFVNEEQLEYIKNHIEVSKDMSKFPNAWEGEFDNRPCDAWNITVDNNFVFGSTLMDNFDFYGFLASIGIDMSKVEFESDDDMFDRF